jgi:hypothetical protein
MSSSAPVVAQLDRERSGLLRVRATVGALLALAVVLQPPAPAFVYDASTYWGGARALVQGGNVFEAGLLELRGVLSSVLYTPAALVVRAVGEGSAGAAVLVQNTLLIVVLAVVLVPALVGLWRPVDARVVVVSALGTGLLLRGFAPFPLTDLWATALLLVVVVGLQRRSRPWLLVAGLGAGVAFNVRPAALVPVLAVGLAVLVARRRAAVWFALGAAVALLPQAVVNLGRDGGWVPLPEGTAALTELQASDASFLIRYDTVVGDPAAGPRRFYCSPGMAQALDGEPPTSPGELVTALLTHVPQSVVFSAQKISAALHWPLSVPYTAPAPVVNGLFALLVTAVSVIGAAALLQQAGEGAGRAPRRRDAATLGRMACALVWLGSLATLVTSSTETRFALTVVVVGIAGCALMATQEVRIPRAAGARAWVIGTVAAVLAVHVIGITGLQHPVADSVTVEACAER